MTPAPYEATLYISYREGAPESVFTLSGSMFPRDAQVSILANGRLLATLDAKSGSSNWFQINIDTENAAEGLYILQATSNTVQDSERFRLDEDEPHREPWVEDVQTVWVPAGIAYTERLFLPVVGVSEGVIH